MGGLRFIFINNLLCQEIEAVIYGYDYLIIDKWVFDQAKKGKYGVKK